ncbi:MAG: DEAD/DEAH box helicase, partial [Candidatus Berkiella sp.]
MNPIKLSQQLQDTLVSYLTTTFDVNRDGQEPALAEFLKQSFTQPQALFAGPYLELTPPYKTAETLQQLAAEGVVSPKLLEMPCFKQKRPLPVDAPLYTHQAAALRKLCAGNRNIVVSSGTGSGKTECFLIPILNDLLIDDTPGVRAVLVYPLNALVNDQLDRLRILLRDTRITFGRYTSELEERAETARRQMKQDWDKDKELQKLFREYPLPEEIIGRDQIQAQGMLPQILITNYAMLEYLLLRPEDNPLFAQGKWRFVVLDEAHTYAGAQGIEVGLLMRRLKHRLGHRSGQMRCIATSATLTDDDANDASKFAQELFGEEFTQDDIIFGELNHDYVPPSLPKRPPVTTYSSEKFDVLIHDVRQEKWESPDEMALLMQEIGLIDDEQLGLADHSDSPKFLWEVLRGNEDLAQLRNIMAAKGEPVEVTTVAEELFRDRLPTDKQQNALYHLIELAAMARPKLDDPSLLPARYHLFVRPPQGIWVCLNPTCSDKQSGSQWSKLFATPRETCETCHLPVYPLVVCRTCGQVYVRLEKAHGQYLPEAARVDEPVKHYVTWRLINENRALAEEDEDEDTLIEQAGESILKQSELVLCLKCQEKVRANGKCGCADKSKHAVTLFLLEEGRAVKKGKNSGVETRPVHEMNECGRCHGRALKGTEIATEISLNALTPLAVLTEDLYRALPESSQPDAKSKAGGGRKLLSFYDSRQGAARFAAFVQDVVNQQAYRRIIREGVSITSTPTYWPDLDQVGDACLNLALKSRVLHNDLEISKGDLPNDPRYLNQNARKRLLQYMCKQTFAEVTTQLRSRQSLEALGLIAVQYFEPGHVPDVSALAKQLQLTELETQTLIEYLLDDLRRGKVVTLPNGVDRYDPIFGRNKFSPRLVRGQDANEYEIAWVGKTTRHRRRQLISKVFRYKGLSCDEPRIIQALERVFDWLIDYSDLFDTSKPVLGYQLRHDRLFFQASAQWYRCNQCQRLSCRGNALPCPHSHCLGTLQPIKTNSLAQKNFFYDNLDRELVPMRIEEHTAQLAPEKGRDYQNQFKNGNINMLSCSTTFEMGIDLGDLQAVVMSNIPPTVANYKQRAGRAGRRSSGTAFILAWASDRPHDQTYFKAPATIIGGRVRIPFLDIQNQIIMQRHVNAILLSEFLRYCTSCGRSDKSVGTFFDEQSPNGSAYKLIPQWINEKQDYLLALLALYSGALKQAVNPLQALNSFEQDLHQKGFEHYQKIAGYYKKVRQEKAEEYLKLIYTGGTQSNIESLSKESDRYGRLLERIRN